MIGLTQYEKGSEKDYEFKEETGLESVAVDGQEESKNVKEIKKLLQKIKL